jgi:hypothetical protein
VAGKLSEKDHRALGSFSEIGLLPEAVSARVWRTRRELGPDVGLRIFLRVTDAAEAAGLLDLPWECADVPSVTTGGAVLVLRDELLSIVRVVNAPVDPSPVPRSHLVVVVDASAVAGPQRVAGTQFVTGSLEGQSSRDAALIRGELEGTPFEPWVVHSPTASSTFAGWDEAWGFYVFGHHLDEVVNRGERVSGLVVPTTREGHVGLLRHEHVAAMLAERRVVVAVFAACHSAGSPDRCATGSLARVVATEGVRFAIGVFGPTRHDSMEDFGERLFRELALGTPVDAAVAAARTAAEARDAIPMLFTCAPHDLVAYQPQVRLPAARTFRGWWLDPGWTPDGCRPLPVTDADPARLDVLLGLVAGRVTTAVADRIGADLRGELEQLSAVLGTRRPSQDGSPVAVARSWHSLDAARAAPEGWASLAAAVAGPGGSRPTEQEFRETFEGRSDELGLVVTYTVTPGSTWSYGGPAAQRLADFVKVRDRLVRDAALVVQVCAEQPTDALLAVIEVARRAGAGRSAFEVLARVAPGAASAAPDQLEADPPDALRVLAGLAGLVTNNRAARGLGVPWPDPGRPAGSEERTGARSPRPLGSPTVVATSVVQALNARPDLVPGGDEGAFLLMVRDWAPGYFGALLAEHAAARSGSAWWYGVRAAAPLDDHLRLWFDAASSAERTELHDGVLPPVDLPPAALASLVWTVSRHTGRPATAAWVRSAGASTARLLSADPTALPASWFEEDPAAVRRWADGAEEPATLLDPVLAETRGFWAVLSSQPVDHPTLDALERVPGWLRRVTDPGAHLLETDPQRAERLEVLGRVLRPYRRPTHEG